MLIPTYTGLSNITSDFMSFITVTSSFTMLKDWKVGRAMYLFACLSLVTILTARWRLLFCIVLPYTELFISLNKSFSNELLAACRLTVLKSIYGFNQRD